MEALLPRRTINKQEYVLLADVTVGTATTSVDITGLNIGKAEEIVLVSDIVNGTGTNAYYYLYSNANYTNTNYYEQLLGVTSSSIVAERLNRPDYMFADSNSKAFGYSSLKLTNNGYVICQSNEIRAYSGSSTAITNYHTTSTFTATSITSLRISANATNAIGIGSRFQLYKVGA